ncbi:hypothetical protein SEA_MISSDAISY_4 [Mycobacterium phage MissDaisy]|nr:hypothetical protein SEA_MISSDAISY_4 [Mycobacterium phage MissDaisy]
MTVQISFCGANPSYEQFWLDGEQFDASTPAGQQAIEEAIEAICPNATVFQVMVMTGEQITLGGETYTYTRVNGYLSLQDYFDSLNGGSE